MDFFIAGFFGIALVGLVAAGLHRAPRLLRATPKSELPAADPADRTPLALAQSFYIESLEALGAEPLSGDRHHQAIFAGRNLIRTAKHYGSGMLDELDILRDVTAVRETRLVTDGRPYLVAH